MPEVNALAKRIRKIRKDMNMSQIEFAANCGISTEILSLIEREKTDPKLSTLQSIAAFTGCEVSELLKVDYDSLDNIYIYNGRKNEHNSRKCANQ